MLVLRYAGMAAPAGKNETKKLIKLNSIKRTYFVMLFLMHFDCAIVVFFYGKLQEP